MDELSRRYPGARPFEQDQQHIFFGREKDIAALSRLIRLEPLVILYGRSGAGKSSLLNAGITPSMQAEESSFDTLRIRFNVWQEHTEMPMPIANIRTSIQQNFELANPVLEEIVPDDFSLWKSVKSHQIASRGTRRLLLLFDQFEELFTYPPEVVRGFRQQLAETLYTDLPQRYWDELLVGEQEMDPEVRALLQKPSAIRLVIAIRSDRLHLLHQLSDFLPLILQNCYELGALDEEQVRDAILLPARSEGEYFSPPFEYTDTALDEIRRFLTQDGRDHVETTQLQIVLSSIEDKVAQTGKKLVEASDLGALDSIISNYYAGKILEIDDPTERLRARRLIEEGLVFEEEERRLSLYEGQIYRIYGLEPETLRRLVDVHLLRAEPSLQGGFSYELSHDTLVGPILEAKAIRKAEEQRQEEERLRVEQAEALRALQAKAEEERLRAEKERSLREQAEKAQKESDQQRRRALLLAAISAVAFLLAVYQYFRADNARIQVARNAAIAQSNNARAFKVQGQYKEAVDLLNSIEPYMADLPAHEKDSINRMKAAWQQIAQYMNQGDSLYRIEALRNALSQYELAKNIATDRFIEQAIARTNAEMVAKFKKYKENGRNLMNSGQYALASENLEKARQLNPQDKDVATWLELCNRQINK